MSETSEGKVLADYVLNGRIFKERLREVNLLVGVAADPYFMETKY